MAKGTRILLGTLLVLASSHQLAQAQNLSLSVQLRNDAGVAGDTLEAARDVVSQIYAKTGIELIWSEDDPRLTIILRPRASKETARRAQDAMGYTPGGGAERGRLAFVMINRVNEIADGYGVARSVVLGAAIAHELGHLLTAKQHSPTGIMKPSFNQSDFRNAREGRLLFSEEQAQAVRRTARGDD